MSNIPATKGHPIGALSWAPYPISPFHLRTHSMTFTGALSVAAKISPESKLSVEFGTGRCQAVLELTTSDAGRLMLELRDEIMRQDPAFFHGHDYIEEIMALKARIAELELDLDGWRNAGKDYEVAWEWR